MGLFAKRVCIVLSLLILTVILASGVSALNLSKTYDASTQTVHVWNGGTNVGDIQLLTPLNNLVIRGSNRLVAEIRLENKLANPISNVFNKMDFYYVKQGMAGFNRDFSYKRRVTTKVNITVFGEVCVLNVSSVNGSQKCVVQEIGSRLEERYSWVSFNHLADLPVGNTVIGIFTDVYPEEKIEWIPTLFGNLELTEFAQWSESLNYGLFSWFAFEEPSYAANSTTAKNEANPNLNGTYNSTQSVTGKVGLGVNMSGNGHVTIPNGAMWRNPTNFSVALWVKTANPSCEVSSKLITRQQAGVGGLQELEIHDNNGGAYTRTTMEYDNATDILVGHLTPAYDDTGNWRFIVITAQMNASGGTILHYENGTQTAVNNHTGSSFRTDVEVVTNLGWWNDGQGTNYEYCGIMDEVGFWNRTLTPSEVTTLWNNSNGMTYEAAAGDTAPTLVDSLNVSSAFTSTWLNFSATFTDPDGSGSVYFNLTVNDSVVASFGKDSVATGSSVSWLVDPANWSKIDNVSLKSLAVQASVSSSTNTTNLTINNSVPSHTDSLNESVLLTGDWVNVSVVFSDDDGSDSGTIYFNLTVNDSVVASASFTGVAVGGSASWLVDPANWSRRDNVSFKTRTFDGTSLSVTNSTNITISNSLPTHSDTLNVTVLFNLTGANFSAVPTDADAGDVLTLYFRLFVDDVLTNAFNTTTNSGSAISWIVSSANWIKGQVVNFLSWVSDGTSDSAVNSTNITVSNSVPSHTDSLNVSALFTVTWVNLTVNFSDDDGSDSGTIYFNLTVNGSVVASETFTGVSVGSGVSWLVDPTNWSKLDNVSFKTRTFDGTSLSSANATNLTVSNSVPGVPSWNKPDNASVVAASSYVINWTNAVDDDSGDVLTYKVFVDNDTSFSSPSVSNHSVSETATVTGLAVTGLDNRVTWYARVRANDGTANGSFSSLLVWNQSLNAVPTLSNLLNESQVFNTTWLNASATYNDSDADAGTVNITLLVAGSPVASLLRSGVASGSSVSWLVDPANWSERDVVSVSFSANESFGGSVSNTSNFTVLFRPALTVTLPQGESFSTTGSLRNVTSNWSGVIDGSGTCVYNLTRSYGTVSGEVAVSSTSWVCGNRTNDLVVSKPGGLEFGLVTYALVVQINDSYSNFDSRSGSFSVDYEQSAGVGEEQGGTGASSGPGVLNLVLTGEKPVSEVVAEAVVDFEEAQSVISFRGATAIVLGSFIFVILGLGIWITERGMKSRKKGGG